MKRVFLIVLDSLGIGEAPDARDFGDAGTNTLRSLYKTGRLNIPNLIKLGIGNIDGVDYLAKTDSHKATVCRMKELSRGKDTTIGHWEIAGIVSESAMPTYPDGFPSEIIETFESAIGRKTLCNKVYSGTEVIKDYGEEHIKTGMPIIYTSADSVFQIAAHEEIIPIDTLYEYCHKARKILTGKHAVGRVIARPFITEGGKFKRTANRHDFSLSPPRKTLLNAISESGLEVISVGKINDIFAGSGITSSNPSLSNSDGMRIASEIQKKDF
jgi:phosphopentomutase